MAPGIIPPRWCRLRVQLLLSAPRTFRNVGIAFNAISDAVIFTKLWKLSFISYVIYQIDELNCLIAATTFRCEVGNSTFADGQLMTMDDCMQCRCKDGIVLCDQMRCENPSCEWLSLDKDECCTTCKGEKCRRWYQCLKVVKMSLCKYLFDVTQYSMQ